MVVKILKAAFVTVLVSENVIFMMESKIVQIIQMKQSENLTTVAKTVVLKVINTYVEHHY